MILARNLIFKLAKVAFLDNRKVADFDELATARRRELTSFYSPRVLYMAPMIAAWNGFERSLPASEN